MSLSNSTAEIELAPIVIPAYLDLINDLMGAGIIPFVSITSITCNLLTIVFVYIHGVDRAALVFVIAVSLADFLITIINGIVMTR